MGYLGRPELLAGLLLYYLWAVSLLILLLLQKNPSDAKLHWSLEPCGCCGHGGRCGELQAARGARGARFIYQRLPSHLASSVTGAKSPVIMQRRKLLS